MERPIEKAKEWRSSKGPKDLAISQVNALLTKIAGSRVTGYAARKIKSLEYDPSSDMVTIGIEELGFEQFPMQCFRDDYVSSRKERAKQELVARQVEGSLWTVYNRRKKTASVVDLSEPVQCSCHDWAWTWATFGQGCCKHQYAVLHELGFESLAEYIKSHSQVA